VHHVPGTHASICSEPNVRSVAARLRESLAEARERALQTKEHNS
jgi:thioesterase domain-containing protein